jgi:hypothetical protein
VRFDGSREGSFFPCCQAGSMASSSRQRPTATTPKRRQRNLLMTASIRHRTLKVGDEYVEYLNRSVPVRDDRRTTSCCSRFSAPVGPRQPWRDP